MCILSKGWLLLDPFRVPWMRYWGCCDGFILFPDTFSKMESYKKRFFFRFYETQPLSWGLDDYVAIFGHTLGPVPAPGGNKHSVLENANPKQGLAFIGPLQSALNALLRMLWWFHTISRHFFKHGKLQKHVFLILWNTSRILRSGWLCAHFWTHIGTSCSLWKHKTQCLIQCESQARAGL